MTEIVENIENGTRALVEEKGLEAGVGFPTGVSLNECAAHYSEWSIRILEDLTSKVKQVADVLRSSFSS